MGVVEAIRQATSHWSHSATINDDVHFRSVHYTDDNGGLPAYRITALRRVNSAGVWLVAEWWQDGQCYSADDHVWDTPSQAIVALNSMATAARDTLGAPAELVAVLVKSTQLMEVEG